MFLKESKRFKDGKEHHYWSLVENRRVDGGRRVVQRHVLYLGEINSSQQAAWRKTIEVFETGSTKTRTVALFPEDRSPAVIASRIEEVGVERRPQRLAVACFVRVKGLQRREALILIALYVSFVVLRLCLA